MHQAQASGSSQIKNTVFTPVARQPQFQCPNCIRRCYSRAGLKNHINAMHSLGVETDNASDRLSASDQPGQSSPQISDGEEEHPMDVDSDAPLPQAFPNAYDDGRDLDSEFAMNSIDHNLHTPSHSSESTPIIIPSTPQDKSRPCEHRQAPADNRFLRRVYHDKLNGQKCDKNGVDIAADSPPPPRESDRGPNDWKPYAGRIEFELADFLYRRNQMSASDIDTLLNLWNASAAARGESGPFQNHKDVYDTIDATPLGDIPWKSFSLQYNGNKPEGEVPSWMDANYDVWHYDVRQLVHNIISNPDFENGFDYTPYQERDGDQSRHYHNFMSANWSWKQAVHDTNELVLY